MTGPEDGDLDIYRPEAYAAGPPHEAFEHLRRTDPVHWQDMPDGSGYWAVLRHADVTTVARSPLLFSASEGGVVLEDLAPDQLAMMRHMLLAMDPPVHDEHRRPLAPSFAPRVVAKMEDRIRAICRALLNQAGEKGEIDFVHDVCAGLPSQVVGELMGLPSGDWGRIHAWAERQSSGQDAGVSGGDADSAAVASVDMAMYAIELARRRRAEAPRDDLTALILASTFGGQPMSDVDFGAFFVQLVTAGNDTTKTMLAAGTLALLDHPDQLAALRSDRSLIPPAVEEILRWANPLHYFRRTATSDAELAGTAIRAGDKVAMVYTSANRDEAVFDDPHRFDIRRQPNPHLSFGIGEHFCLGAHLARLEGRVFFEELLATFPTIERTGEPRRIRSNLNNGLEHLPLRLLREAPARARPRTTTRDPDELGQRLERWLHRRLGPSARPQVAGLEAPSTNGMSSETILFDAIWHDERGRREERLVARVAPDSTAVPVFPRYDLDRQARVMRLVGERTAVPVPSVHWSEPDDGPLGAPFFVMDRIDGRVPPDVMPYNFGSWLSESSPADQARLQDATVAVLAELHGMDDATETFSFLAPHGGAAPGLRAHVESQRTYYEWVADGLASPLLERCFGWLDEHWPAQESPTTLSWGDARIGNVIYRGFEPAAVLDWEMASLAPPEVDLGWFIYLHRFFEDLAADAGLAGMPHFLRRDDVATTYASHHGQEPRDLDFYTLYAALRHGIVMSRVQRRAIHFGEATMPDDVDDLIMHRATLEAMLAGTYWAGLG